MVQTEPKAVTLFLEKGARFDGMGWGDFSRVRGGEFVFCTAMSGIEESLTDPSFTGQVLVTTVAHVGNTGFTGEDLESDRIWAEGLVCRHLDRSFSNWRAKFSIRDWILGEGRFAIEGVDTRELAILLREQGSQRGIILEKNKELKSSPLDLINEHIPPMSGRDLTKIATCRTQYRFTHSSLGFWPIERELPPKTLRENQDTRYQIAVWDFGVKRNTLRLLSALGADVTVLPATAKADELLAAGANGLLLSNGPGDPAAATYVIKELRQVLGRRPVFAICLGHQLVALAAGSKTYKMSFGHRGIHHPVVELGHDGVPRNTWITSQNHGFAVEADSLPENTRISFIHADDGTVEGLSIPEYRCETVQFHPEAAPGPYDASILLSRFISRLES